MMANRAWIAENLTGDHSGILRAFISTSLTLCILLCFGSASVAQTTNAPEHETSWQLILTKTKSGKQRHIREGKTLKVVATDGRKFKGEFRVINSTPYVGETSLNLTETERIVTHSAAARIAGGLLTCIGGAGTGLGAITFAQAIATNDACAKATLLIVAIPLTAAGLIVTTPGVLMIVVGKKFKRTKWNYTLVEMPDEEKAGQKLKQAEQDTQL